MAKKNWLNSIIKSTANSVTRSAARSVTSVTKTPRKPRRPNSWASAIRLPNALKPKNIITSVVTRSVSQVIRKFIGSIFKSK
ncbi:MAG: hypothetical protein LBU69_01010 [Deltaproteobacteria bacterium]|nr:hypothetical protein [Deltaproteobacteria bacterium]